MPDPSQQSSPREDPHRSARLFADKMMPHALRIEAKVSELFNEAIDHMLDDITDPLRYLHAGSEHLLDGLMALRENRFADGISFFVASSRCFEFAKESCGPGRTLSHRCLNCLCEAADLLLCRQWDTAEESLKLVWEGFNDHFDGLSHVSSANMIQTISTDGA